MKNRVKLMLMLVSLMGSLHIKAWTDTGVNDIPAQGGHVQVDAQQDPIDQNNVFQPQGVSAKPFMANYIEGATALAAAGLNFWAIFGQKNETLKFAIPSATLAAGIAGLTFCPSPRAAILTNMRWDINNNVAVLQANHAPNEAANGTALDERIVLYQENGNNLSYHRYSKLNELKPQYYANAAAYGLCAGVGAAAVVYGASRLLES